MSKKNRNKNNRPNNAPNNNECKTNNPNGQSNKSDVVDANEVRGYDNVRGGSTRVRNNGSGKRPYVANMADGRNDVEWHVHDLKELTEIASWSYPQAMGIPFKVRGEHYNPAGMCVADVTPTYGFSDSPDSAMNQGVRKVYAAMRSHNSGQAMETPTAYGFYIMAFDSIYYLMQHVQRAFQLSTIFNNKNRYWPKRVMEALGFNYKDVIDNKPNYVAKYNNYVRAVAAWNVPDSFEIFKRHQFLFGNLFKDSDQAKDQLYAYRPTGYYVYDEINESGVGSKLTWVPIKYFDKGVAKTYTLNEWMGFIDDAISHIVRAKSAQNCSGDTEKAFDSASIVKVRLITGDEAPSISLDDDAREMFMNATIVGDVTNLGVTESISSNPNEDLYFITSPKIYNRHDIPTGDELLISTYRPNPDPKTNLEITRFMHSIDYIPDAAVSAQIALTTQLPDVIERYIIVTIDANNYELSDYKIFGPTIGAEFAANIGVGEPDFMTSMKHMLEQLALWSMFDYAPHCYLDFTLVNPPVGSDIPEIFANYHTPLVKLTNYTTISKSKLRDIAEITIQKNFGF